MKLNKLYGYSILSFIFLLSFTSAFSIGPYLQGYVIGSIFLILMTILHVLFKGKVPRIIRRTDIPIIIFLLIILLVSIIIPNPKTINYFIVYIYIFLILYLCFKYALYEIGVDKILHFNLIGVIFTSIFVLLDTFMGLVFLVDLQSYIYRNNAPLQVPDGITVQRAYGFSNEPTNLSSYFLSMGALAIYYVKSKFLIRYFYCITLLVLAPLILTFSGSAFAAIGLTFIIFIFFALISVFFKFNFLALKFITISLVMATATYSFSFNYVNLLMEKVLFRDKSFGSGRGEMWLSTIDLITDNIFMPHGLGYASSIQIPIVNWYLMLALELGLISVFIIIAYAFIVAKFIFNSRIKRFDQGFLVFFLFAGFIQLNGYSTFYYPYAILFALTAVEIARQANIKKIHNN